MKAKEILNTLRDDYYDCYERGLAKKDDWVHIDEALAELEAKEEQIQKMKCCGNCKGWCKGLPTAQKQCLDNFYSKWELNND